jgi:hypothetical protein
MTKALQPEKTQSLMYFFTHNRARTRDVAAKSREAQRLVRARQGSVARARRA